MSVLTVTPVVEMAFGKTWQDEIGEEEWTDITSYVREAVTDVGRQRQLSRPEAGVCGLTLSNQDRRFEPGYTSGAYWPDIRIGVPVRITATPDDSYAMWYGFVTSWPQTWPGRGGSDSTVKVVAVDGFQFLALADVSPYPVTVAGLSPFSCWRQQETEGTDCDDSGSDANDGTYSGSPTLGSAGPLTGDSYAVTYGAAKYMDAGVPTGSFDACDEWTWMSWLYRAGTSETVFRMDSANLIVIAVDGSGKITVTFDSTITLSGVTETVTAATALEASTWTHVTISFADDQTVIYLDGEADKQQVVQLAAAASVTESFRISASSGGWTGRIAETSVWDYMLDNGTVQQVAAATIGSHPEETADVRIGRLLDAAGWPAASRDLDTGDSTLTAVDEPGGSALEQILRAGVDSEMGYFFQAPDGVMTFFNRGTLSGGAAADSFSDDDYTDVTVGFDVDSLYTQVRITLGDGSLIVKGDAEAISAYGPRALERTADIPIADSLDMAASLLSRYSTPRVRISQVEFQPESDSSLYAALLALSVWDKITLSRTPPGGGAALSNDYWIEGIQHEVTPDEWTVMFSCSPTGDTEAWVLGTSALDQTTYLGY